MKQKLYSCFLLLLLVFLLKSSHMSARLLSAKQGQVELQDAAVGDSLLKIEDNDFLNNLMGLKNCESGEQECLQRRFLADAHLDYIYTQQHKP